MKTVKDICKEYGYSQTRLAKRFGIPLRTVQNWHGGQREPAPYVVPMMEEILKAEKAGGVSDVVRCVKCAHREIDTFGRIVCLRQGQMIATEDDGYCHHGERRANDVTTDK